MIWSDKHGMWMDPDNRTPEQKAKDERIAKEYEDQEKAYAPLKKKFEAGYPPFINVGLGWKKIIFDLVRKLNANKIDWSISQVKEKFGILRFIAGVREVPSAFDVEKKFFDVIRKAEEKSSKTCEYCGNHGKLEDIGGWVKTLCPDCLVARKK